MYQRDATIISTVTPIVHAPLKITQKEQFKKLKDNFKTFSSHGGIQLHSEWKALCNDYRKSQTHVGGIGIQLESPCPIVGKVGGGGQIVTDICLKESLANRGAPQERTLSWGQYQLRFASYNSVKTCHRKEILRYLFLESFF